MPNDRDYRDVAARHHVDCACSACELAAYEEREQRQYTDAELNPKSLGACAAVAAETYEEAKQLAADAIFDPKLWFVDDPATMKWDDLVTWLVANPCDSEQSRATKLLAAFVMRRKA